MSDPTTIPDNASERELAGVPSAPAALALSIAWSTGEPQRVGETAIVPRGLHILGRGAATDGQPRLSFARHRPGEITPTGPLVSPQISRNQLAITLGDDDELEVQNTGRCALLHNGVPCTAARVRAGDTLAIGTVMLLVCVERPAWLRPWPFGLLAPFGAPDAHGLVGESPAAWSLRRALHDLASRDRHVLVTGPSGTGKELAARAIHALSPRGRCPLISRSAATIPDGLADAELFGNIKNYPNPGMPERPGLLGEADGSTLFLDEIAELPLAIQAHLLRVLDGGEYQRLGDARSRRADVRVVGATNRPLSMLKEDVLARFSLRVELPGLNQRLEDISLIVAHLLRSAAATDGRLRARLFPDGDMSRLPVLPLAIVDALLRRRYATHVRELELLLWRAALDEPPPLSLSARSQAGGSPDLPVSSPPPSFVCIPQEPAAPSSPGSPSVPDIRGALDAANGSIERAYKSLGLASRHVLTRLIKKHGIEIRKAPRR
jgi:DNA-binding NtrC family response regulator